MVRVGVAGADVAERDAAALGGLDRCADALYRHVGGNRTVAEDAVVASHLDRAELGLAEAEEGLADVDVAVLRDGAVGGGGDIDADQRLDVPAALAGRDGGDQGARQQAVADRGAARLAAAAERAACQRHAAVEIVFAVDQRVEGVDVAADVDGPLAGLDVDRLCGSCGGSGKQTQHEHSLHRYLLVMILGIDTSADASITKAISVPSMHQGQRQPGI
jgi:hypothetical protein